uniref:Amidase n=1 Tax=Caulobacter sp. (strain K31) TaxID=366602 RepID=B0T7Y4_CAUSK
MDFLQLDAVDQIEALARSQITAVRALELAVERADALQARVNAVTSRRIGAARAEAQAIDEARQRGQKLGRLAGLPMTVKDTLDIEGLPASAGRMDLTNRQVHDAEVVRRVRSEGAVVWGHTNTPVNAGDWQTHNKLYGVTRNPWNEALTCGGSSGGSAAALAAGISALEIGADIAGSLRIPASLCGVMALKPTFGLISQAGLVPPAEGELDMAVVGPMARSARDLALLFSILTEAPATTGVSVPLRGLRAGLWLDESGFATDLEIRRSAERFAETLRDEGARVEACRGPIGGEAILETYTSLIYPLLWANAPRSELAVYRALRLPAKLARRLGAGPLSWAKGVLAATSSAAEQRRAQVERLRLAADVQTFFEQFDVLIAPTAPTPAFPHDHRSIHLRRLKLTDGRKTSYLQMMAWPALASVWKLPALAFPIGLSRDGLPIGVQLMGRPGSDTFLLDLAQTLEARLGGFQFPQG